MSWPRCLPGCSCGARAPLPGAKVAKLDDSKGKAVKGVKQVISLPTGVAVLATGFATGAAAQAPATCGATLDAKARLLAEVPGWQVVFVPKPAPVAVGRHFTLELAVWPK